jgi:hypothetical protein
MACASCAKNRQRININLNNGGTTTRRYTKVKYTGPTGEIDSVVPGISYGYKETNTVMFAEVRDVNQNPEIWEII